MPINIMDVVNGFEGATIASIDTCTDVTLQKRLNEKNTSAENLRSLRAFDYYTRQKSNLLTNNTMIGRVQKITTGSSIMLFTNKNSNAYQNMVKRRLAAEGKDPETFKLSARPWGTRIPETPLVENEKDGEIQYYLEAIYLRAGETRYVIDGTTPIERKDIYGLPPVKIREDAQAGLENMVIVRTLKLSSITEIRANGQVYSGEFVYSP